MPPVHTCCCSATEVVQHPNFLPGMQCEAIPNISTVEDIPGGYVCVIRQSECAVYVTLSPQGCFELTHLPPNGLHI